MGFAGKMFDVTLSGVDCDEDWLNVTERESGVLPMLAG
jgi:hypothetical protein